MKESDLKEAVAMDARAFGAERGEVLSALFQRQPALASLVRDGKTAGFCLAREGSLYHQIGPIVAGSPEQAAALAESAFSRLLGKPVALDVPASQHSFINSLTARGLSITRSFTRMARGAAPRRDPSQYFAAAGPDLG
jgi:hypothetical protein